MGLRPPAVRENRFRTVLSDHEFSAALTAEVLSGLGDQLAQVSLMVLVYQRSGSSALAGLTYALNFLPAVLGALLLSPVADRVPPRTVAVGIDGARTLIVVAMLLPGAPLGVLWLLVGSLSFLDGPYKAARLALLRRLVPADRYALGVGVRRTFTQAAWLLGYAASGTLVAVAGARGCLLIDAGSFAVAAVLMRFRVTAHPPARTAKQPGRAFSGLRIVLSDRRRRVLVAAVALGACYIVPEAVAAPYVAESGLGTNWVGLVPAGPALGTMIAVPLFSRLARAERHAAIFPALSVLTGIPLILIFLVDGPAGVVLFAITGGLWTIQAVICSSLLATSLPPGLVATGMGIGASLNVAVAGLGALLAGAVAQALGTHATLVLAGVVAVAGAAALGRWWTRAFARRPGRKGA